MLAQFSEDGDRPTLKALGDLPSDVYPVGRLDADSEGLLVLTNDKRLNHLLLDPKFKHSRTYLVQVDGDISSDALDHLKSGVEIRVNKKDVRTKRARARKMDLPDWVPERDPPVRYRANIPTSWIELTLFEGKNRQVRRMTAKVGFPTLRLIRSQVESLSIDKMSPGDIIEIDRKTCYLSLNIPG